MNRVLLFVKTITKPHNFRPIHSTVSQLKEDRRRWVLSMPKADEGTMGEKNVQIDAFNKRKEDLFPTKDLPNQLFFGIPFKELPICHVKATKNNTIMSFTDHRGVLKLLKSCGTEGFKNARKGTNIAAQTTAINFSVGIIEKGIKNVRVCVQGLGPGRMSSIKGLQMGGLNVISITDTTRVSWNPPRPRKRRRV